MKAYIGGKQLWLHSFLTSALDGEWLTSGLGCFTPRLEPIEQEAGWAQGQSGHSEDKHILPPTRI
jgi:hypothetical protein